MQRSSRPSESEPEPRRKRSHKPSRGFTEIPINILGHQPCTDRHAALTEDGTRPRHLESWRHNLTALSQVHNLFIVANGPVLEFYRPQYPSQKISFPPSLVIQLPVSAPGLQGHMPGSPPHAVNHLLVATLGQKEIVLCACDDGDALAYHTDSVMTMIEQWVNRLNERAASELRPFFHVNVGNSAWGLAVHEAARLIAVSANSYCVTVFAFALKTPSSHEPAADPPSDEECYSSKSIWLPWEEDVDGSSSGEVVFGSFRGVRDNIKPLLDDRERDFAIPLQGHRSNIPSIAFCNTPDDPSGRWLMSTDISGHTILWDTTRALPSHRLAPEYFYYPNAANDSTYDPIKGGWGLAWIDERAFSLTKDVIEAMGTGQLVTRGEIALLDTTHSRTMVKHSKRWKIGDGPGLDETADDELDGFDSADDDDDDYEEQDHVELSETGGATPYSTTNHIFLCNRDNKLPHRHFRGNRDEDSSLGARNWPMFGLRAEDEELRVINTALPKAPLLLLTNHGVHLFQSAMLDRRSRKDPVIYLENPLQQDVAVPVANSIRRFDRLNLFLQIPELGIVLVGSPKGRVGILTLHRIFLDMNDSGQPVYTTRLDHLVPFCYQEDVLHRPTQQLVGLAASPMQGNAPEHPCSRWRIMLTYRDYTILSYEIRREPHRPFDTEVVVV